MDLSFQFFMYWFIVRENFNLLQVCESNTRKLGYCMSSLQCSDIVNGTVIGQCTSETVRDSAMSETTGNICCFKTLDFYNETYFMQPIFTISNSNETSNNDMILRRILNVRPTNYVNKPLGPERIPLKPVTYDEKIHICIPPDIIQWRVAYSIDNIEKSKRIIGKTMNYSLVTFHKVYDEKKKNLTIECLIQSNVLLSEISEDENGTLKYYTKFVEVDDIVPLRKFLSSEIQNLRLTTYKDDTESLLEETNQEFSRRMLDYETLQEKESGEKLVDSATDGRKKIDDNLLSRSEL